MAYIAKITNTLDQIVKANYRMPLKEGMKFSPVLEVVIQPRALMNDIVFADETFFKEWARQNESLFKQGILIEGKAKEKEIIAKNELNAEAKIKTAQEKINKNIDDIQNSADNIGAKIDIKSESVGRKRK